MTKVINRLLTITLSVAMLLTGFTFIGGPVAVFADEGDKPDFVIIDRDPDYDEEFQPASGGKYVWYAQDGSYSTGLYGMVTEDDFKLQTKKVTGSEWTDATEGTLSVEWVDDWDARISASIPDNTNDYDIQWIIVYKHSEQTTQYPTCESVAYTQMKAETPAVEKPALYEMIIDETSGSGATQPAAGGVYAWYIWAADEGDFEESGVTGDDFIIQVKVGDSDWDTSSEATASFEVGTNYDEGLVTATIPDNTENVEKQWRFFYEPDTVSPAITQEAYKAPEWSEDCFTYSDNSTTITGLTDEGKAMVNEKPEMVLPASHNGVAITAIGANAFANVKITGVQLPDTLNSIGNAAFNGCSELQSLTLPASLETLGMQVFNNTTKLESVTFEEGIKLTEIPQAAFQKVTIGVAIKKIEVPEGITKIGANAFGGSLVEDLTLPSSLVTIDQRAFMNNKLSSLVIPDKVTSIGNMSFSQQHARAKDTLTSLTLGADLESIGKQAFDSVKLASVDIPAKLKTLDVDAFKNNSGGESADKRVILNVSIEEQFNGEGDYAGYVATGSGHRSSFNGTTNYVIKFDTAGRSTKNDAYTKGGKLSESDLSAARSSQAYDVFDGWFTDATEGEKVEADKVYDSDTTLYAHWSENTALKDAEEAVTAATATAGEALTAAEKAAETGADEDVKAAADALDAAVKAANDANEKLTAAQEFAASHSISTTGTSRINTAKKNFANANATVTKLDADAAAKAAEEASAAASTATPGTQDAVDKAAAAKEAADKALAKAETAKAAAEAAYGADSEQAQAAAAAVETAKTVADKAAETKTAADKAKADADKAKADAAAKAAEAKKAAVKTVTVNVKTVTAATIDKAVAKAGGSNKYVTKIVLGSKVKTIKASAFKKYTKVTTLEVKTKKLTKKSVKKSLKGSKVKTVKVTISKKASVNKKYVKKYKKFFTKANAGKKATVKK